MTGSQTAIHDACERARAVLLGAAPKPPRDALLAAGLFAPAALKAQQERLAAGTEHDREPAA